MDAQTPKTLASLMGWALSRSPGKGVSDRHGCAHVAGGHECREARDRATHGAVAEGVRSDVLNEHIEAARNTADTASADLFEFRNLELPFFGHNMAAQTSQGIKEGYYDRQKEYRFWISISCSYRRIGALHGGDHPTGRWPGSG